MPNGISTNAGSRLPFEATYRVIVIPAARLSAAALPGRKLTRATVTAHLFPRSAFGVRKGVAGVTGALARMLSMDGYFFKKKGG
jgi:hypothetical protein